MQPTICVVFCIVLDGIGHMMDPIKRVMRSSGNDSMSMVSHIAAVSMASMSMDEVIS